LDGLRNLGSNAEVFEEALEERDTQVKVEASVTYLMR